MAFVQQTTLIRLRYRDNDETESTCQVNYAPSVPIDTLQPLVSSWRSIMGALSSAVCIGADIVIRFQDTALAAPGTLSSVKRSGLFTYTTSAALYAVFRVPSIANMYVCTDGDFPGIEIDRAMANIVTFTNAMVDGLSGTQACDIDASDLTSLSQAYIEQY